MRAAIGAWPRDGKRRGIASSNVDPSSPAGRARCRSCRPVRSTPMPTRPMSPSRIISAISPRARGAQLGRARASARSTAGCAATVRPARSARAGIDDVQRRQLVAADVPRRDRSSPSRGARRVSGACGAACARRRAPPRAATAAAHRAAAGPRRRPPASAHALRGRRRRREPGRGLPSAAAAVARSTMARVAVDVRRARATSRVRRTRRDEAQRRRRTRGPSPRPSPRFAGRGRL